MLMANAKTFDGSCAQNVSICHQQRLTIDDGSDYRIDHHKMLMANAKTFEGSGSQIEARQAQNTSISENAQFASFR